MKGILTYLFVLGTIVLSAQNTKEREVISAGGIEQSTTRIRVSSTIGETVITSEQSATSPLNITQGFHQVGDIDTVTIDSFIIGNVACIGRRNGFISIDTSGILGCAGPYQFSWTGSNNFSSTNSDVFGLDTGTYNVTISSSDGCQKSFSFQIGFESSEPCFIDFFSGITPDGDGVNDVWMIENIEAFPDNKVTIFNRLGNIVFEENNYDNQNVVWRGNSGNNFSGNELPSDTYFYVFESNGQFEKGWIELTRF